MSIIRPTRPVASTVGLDGRKRRMRALDLGVACAGLLLLAVSGFLARNGLAVGERAVFEFVNSWPDVLYVVIWPFMQYGVFVTIPILVAVAMIARRYRLAVAMAVAGFSVYVVAKWLKHEVGRGRPGALLDGVHERESFDVGSVGYPSGHLAVAAALTMVVTPYLRGRWKLVPAALVIVVAIGRIYVGAHLPLDLIGGAALGASAGAFANVMIGTPAQH